MRHWVGSICNRLKSSVFRLWMYVCLWLSFWFWPFSLHLHTLLFFSTPILNDSISSTAFNWLHNGLTSFFVAFQSIPQHHPTMNVCYVIQNKSRSHRLKIEAMNNGCSIVGPWENQSQLHWKSRIMAPPRRRLNWSTQLARIWMLAQLTVRSSGGGSLFYRDQCIFYARVDVCMWIVFFVFVFFPHLILMLNFNILFKCLLKMARFA